MKTFEVRRAAFIRDEDLNIEYLVLAQGPEGEGARLEISRAIAYDDQDRALGQDTYSLSDETGQPITVVWTDGDSMTRLWSSRLSQRQPK